MVSAHTVAGEASALLHVMAEDTQDLELCLERIRATDGISRTVTEVVLSTLLRALVDQGSGAPDSSSLAFVWHLDSSASP